MVVGLMALVGVISYFFEEADPSDPQSSASQTIAPQPSAQTHEPSDRSDALSQAFAQQRSNVQVQGTGTVDRILSDDNDGSRHQRFIIRTASGQTLLIAHNIDLAPRVEGIAEGDSVVFYGEYEWNPQGGVIHWTHRDPQGRHEAGWIEHEGKRYQ